MLQKVISKSLLSKGLPTRSVSLLINSQFLTEEQKMIQQTAYDFTKDKISPFVA